MKPSILCELCVFTHSKTKCTSEVLSQFLNIEAEGKLDFTIIDTNMNNPNKPGEQCVMLHVNNCYVVYPSKFV